MLLFGPEYLSSSQILVILTIGTLLGALFAVIFQPQIILELSNSSSMTIIGSYKVLVDTITGSVSIPTDSEILNYLLVL